MAFDSAATVHGGDIGDQSDAEAVAAYARSALAQGTARESAPQAGAAAPAAGAAAPTAKASATAGTSASPATTPVPPTPQCETQARSAGGPNLGTLVYFATLRWRGQPAEFLAFANRQGYVMGRASCAVLAAPRF